MQLGLWIPQGAVGRLGDVAGANLQIDCDERARYIVPLQVTEKELFAAEEEEEFDDEDDDYGEFDDEAAGLIELVDHEKN
jgi:hypothetical protein